MFITMARMLFIQRLVAQVARHIVHVGTGGVGGACVVMPILVLLPVLHTHLT